MKKYTEKKTRKYVIATFSNPTQYLKKTPSKNEYVFTEDIEYATKTLNKRLAEQIKKYFYIDTNIDLDLIVLPIEITYELINENDE
jgi:hypothetical protein